MTQNSNVRGAVADIIGARAVVAVVEIADPSHAPALAETLGEAGISAIEITARTPAVMAAIEAASQTHALPVGAGTIHSVALAKDAVSAGAQFLVAPTFDRSVSDYSNARGVPLISGGVTPTEVGLLQAAGFREAKIFPAAQFGGLGLIKSLAAVFPDMAFMPTGGVGHDEALAYLAHPQVMAVGGTWIAPRTLIESEDWAEIRRRAVAIVEELEREA